MIFFEKNNEIAILSKLGLDRIEFFHSKPYFEYRNIEIDDIKKYNRNAINYYIPMGSLQFVNRFTKHIYNFEIPIITYNFENHIMKECKFEDILKFKKFPFFIKSKKLKIGMGEVIETYRDLSSYMQLNPMIDNESEMYYTHTIRDFKTEWRVYVNNLNILKICNYLGTPTIFPAKEFLKKLESIISNKNNPICYTIDIGLDILTNEWYIIELNDFYSLGNYGLGYDTYFNCSLMRFNEILRQNYHS